MWFAASTIVIDSECNENSGSVTEIEDNYEYPQELDPDSDEAKHFLNDGEEEFQVNEIEVYKIV